MKRSDAPEGPRPGEQLAGAETNSAVQTPAPAETPAYARAVRKRGHLRGAAFTLVILIAVGFFIIRTTRQGPMVARQTPVPSSEATVEASPRFSVSAADVGWARYEAPTGDFSLALPPSWTRYTKRIEGLGPELKFAAWGVSYESHGNPWLYVFKRPVDSWLEAKTYFEHVRLRVVLDPVTVRVSELTEIEFLDGVGYSFTSVHKGAGAGGRRTETVYAILHDGYEYGLVFLVPLQYKDDHDWLFDDIVKTFDIIA